MLADEIRTKWELYTALAGRHPLPVWNVWSGASPKLLDKVLKNFSRRFPEIQYTKRTFKAWRGPHCPPVDAVQIWFASSTTLLDKNKVKIWAEEG